MPHARHPARILLDGLRLRRPPGAVQRTEAAATAERVRPHETRGRAAAARTAFDLLDRRATGIFHVAARLYPTRFEMGLEICDVFSLEKGLLKAARLAAAELRARRPSDSSLDVGKVERFLDKRSPTFREALEDMRDTE
ncbi:MAG: sugar nucleotide-binding protein [Methanobacteriota archaeon]|nr:MAG: sugar nucleotide-binding protein [Euryarchaeota archaeon]